MRNLPKEFDMIRIFIFILTLHEHSKEVIPTNSQQGHRSFADYGQLSLGMVEQLQLLVKQTLSVYNACTLDSVSILSWFYLAWMATGQSSSN